MLDMEHLTMPARALKALALFMSQDETLPTLKRIMVEVYEHDMLVIATDGHTLCVLETNTEATHSLDPDKARRYTVLAEDVKKLTGIAKRKNDVLQFLPDEGKVIVKWGETVTAVVGVDFHLPHHEVETKRFGSFTCEHTPWRAVMPGYVTRYNGQATPSEARDHCNSDGSLTIGFNAVYLARVAELQKSIDAIDTVWRFPPTVYDPAHFRLKDRGVGFQGLIMPMRVAKDD